MSLASAVSGVVGGEVAVIGGRGDCFFRRRVRLILSSSWGRGLLLSLVGDISLCQRGRLLLSFAGEVASHLALNLPSHSQQKIVST